MLYHKITWKGIIPDSEEMHIHKEKKKKKGKKIKSIFRISLNVKINKSWILGKPKDTS